MRQFILIFLALVLISCESNNQPKVTIAVANNMRYAMEEIALAFEKKHQIEVEVSSASSGTLTTQVKQGAPFDIFISANMRYPNILFDEGFTVDAPKVYAYGSLVLWSNSEINIDNGLKSLLQSSINKIAVANPETAPYGIAAIEALKNANLYDTLKSKIILGEGISQVNQYIKSNAVDVGLTSKSVLFSPKIKNKGKSIEIDRHLYTPIEQGIIILKNGAKNNAKNAELFYNFMFSDETKSILTKFGYKVN